MRFRDPSRDRSKGRSGEGAGQDQDVSAYMQQWVRGSRWASELRLVREIASWGVPVPHLGEIWYTLRGPWVHLRPAVPRPLADRIDAERRKAYAHQRRVRDALASVTAGRAFLAGPDAVSHAGDPGEADGRSDGLRTVREGIVIYFAIHGVIPDEAARMTSAEAQCGLWGCDSLALCDRRPDHSVPARAPRRDARVPPVAALDGDLLHRPRREEERVRRVPAPGARVGVRPTAEGGPGARHACLNRLPFCCRCRGSGDHLVCFPCFAAGKPRAVRPPGDPRGASGAGHVARSDPGPAESILERAGGLKT